MNQKGFANIILVIIIVILVGLVGYFAFIRKPEAPPVTPTPSPTTEEAELTNEIALSLLKNDLFGGECRPEGAVYDYDSCTMNISKENNQWIVTITYDGLKDDSIKASRIRTNVTYQNGQWVKGEISRSQQCWPGRGHQDFSAELCI